ncbi:radical SAM protein [Amylibacter sp. SFDW26]|uniref:radical SAM protein n=1 Tax=Amylibacter sp. SFDW26 TaxID=2652722 RepID=UPI0012620324|nr:radical SAM protein [Amylibacter sp. SFDW26]KAB7615307.1 radical SAM protein [Amylibacter sp. SFDW26]
MAKPIAEPKVYLSKQEIHSFHPSGTQAQKPDDLAYPLRSALERENLFAPEQIAGRTFPIACVALEITQRCNLDCTLCYLSDMAEAVQDVPMFELKRRIKMIYDHYGDYTNVQITGGDPTLRSIPDLVEIVSEIKSYGMRSALFTNGIKASREMLKALAQAGLNDVVFHVDMTQERKGYASEKDLDVIRLEYIERAQNLNLRVLFNTTIFDQNVADIPRLVKFFKDHADSVNLASFQMQADTGRGVLRERDVDLITQQSVMQLIEMGADTPLTYDMPMIGHPDCNKYTALLVAGNSVTSLYDDAPFFTKLFAELAQQGVDWTVDRKVLPRAMKACLTSPKLMRLGLLYSLKKAWALRAGLLRGYRPQRISFFIHNFMDAEKLEKGRCEACVFMVATADGPLSMCVHNAKRDAMITKAVPQAKGQTAWDPLTPHRRNIGLENMPYKKLKGRQRAAAAVKRKKVA